MSARHQQDDFGRLFDSSESKLVEEVIRLRRDIRGNHFIDRRVPEDVVERILDAAVHAPSVGYSQPWAFVVVRDAETRKRVRASFDFENERAKRMFNGDRGRRYARLKLEGIEEAPVNIAAFYVPSHGPVLGQTTQEAVGRYSVVCAVQNMWLVARALNVGMGWVSILDPHAVAGILGAPANAELVAWLCLGYVDRFEEHPELERVGWGRRRSKQATVHDERFPSRATDSK